METKKFMFTDAQLKSEIQKCEFCEEKPCREACPSNCSPADFIMAAKCGRPSDYKRAAYVILKNNPLGGVCGILCPDYHCMKACVHKELDGPVKIPRVQAAIIEKARELGVLEKLPSASSNGKKVAVIGAGPAGLGASALLARKGYCVDLFESGDEKGGMCKCIPEVRLPSSILNDDVSFVLSLGNINLKSGNDVSEPGSLINKGYNAVLVATGLVSPIMPKITGIESCHSWRNYLENPDAFKTTGKVAVIGGGATAVDCAIRAKLNGASSVEMFALENIDEMPITAEEFALLLSNNIAINSRNRISRVSEVGRRKELKGNKVALKKGQKIFVPDAIEDLPDTEFTLKGYEFVVVAAGSRRKELNDTQKAVFFAD